MNILSSLVPRSPHQSVPNKRPHLERPNNRSAAESTPVVCLLPISSSDVHRNIVRCGSSTSSSDVWMTSSAVGLDLLFTISTSHSSSHYFIPSSHLLVECPQGHCPLWVCILLLLLTHSNLKIRLSTRYALCFLTIIRVKMKFSIIYSKSWRGVPCALQLGEGLTSEMSCWNL